MTVLMRVGTLKANLKNGTYSEGEVIIYNPAKIVAVCVAAKGAWRVQLVENRWFLVKDVDGKPDYGYREYGWS